MLLQKKGKPEVGRVRLHNHLVLAAGILGTTGASLSRILASGAGAVVTKSIGPAPREGHAGPCLIPLENGLLNAMGLPNPSREFTTELRSVIGGPVIVSIFGGTPEEFGLVASWFTGQADAFELNLSCPHAEGFGAAIGTDPQMVEECTRAVARQGLPVWVKLTPNVTDITVIGEAAVKGGADALVAVNTVKAMRISTELRRPVLGNRYGGLSGKMIFPVAVRCVYELYEACRIPIVGCGGVTTASDVIEMMLAGASAVQIGSSVYDDVGVFQKITRTLYGDAGAAPEDIIGRAHER